MTSRLRAFLKEEGDFATVLRGAGLVVVIRILASAVGLASVILLAAFLVRRLEILPSFLRR